MWYNESDPALLGSPGQHHNPTRKGAAMPDESSKKIELARRAVKSKHWRWMAGMGTNRGRIWETVADDGGPLDPDSYRLDSPRCALMHWSPWQEGRALELLPDLDDPATLGCLVALVREAWNDGVGQISGAGFDQRADGSPCYSVWCFSDLIGEAATEAAALVAALEAAP